VHAAPWLRMVALIVTATVVACGAEERPAEPAVSPSPTTALPAEPTASPTATVPAPPSAVPGPPLPASWGPFVIVAPTSTKTTPIPRFGPDAIDTGMVEGPDAPAVVAAAASRFVDAPPEARIKLAEEGFAAEGALAEQDASGAFWSFVLYSRTTPSPAGFQIRAYTPTGPVPVTHFPESPIWEVKVSHAVDGNPTITKSPHPVTASPDGERAVSWSQDGAVYELTVIGPFTDDEVLAYARAISASERAR
jgi:hypothetical protein